MAVLEKISRLLENTKISEWRIKKKYAAFDRQWKNKVKKMKNEQYLKKTTEDILNYKRLKPPNFYMSKILKLKI